MTQYSLVYEDFEQLQSFVLDKHLAEYKNILIQVFAGTNEYEFIEVLIQELLDVIPQAALVGATTSGEIIENKVLNNSTVLSFTVFEHTYLKTYSQVHDTLCSYELGTHMMKSIPPFYNKQSLQAIITFTDGLSTNGEEYLSGMSKVCDSVVMAGGMAGDNAAFQQTYVFTEKGILSDGAVAVALYNDDLNVYSDYNFSWQSLGRSHWVEHSEKNRVYLIDDMTAVEFYSYFLGENIANMLPSVGVEFPLVIKKDGIDVARAVLTKYDDGSLGFAGNVPQGSAVRFGYGDVQMILDKGMDKAKELSQQPVEAIFVYSCMARKALLQNEINNEIHPLQRIAPTTGFFTYGEFFYHKNSAKLLNQTMTILALSETKKVNKSSEDWFKNNDIISNQSLDFYRTQALSQLVSKITNELEDINGKLGHRVSQEMRNSLEKDEIIYANARYAQMGEILDMIVHQWRQPLNIFSAGISSLQLYHNMGVLTDEIFNKTTTQVLKNVDFLNKTIEDFRSFFKNAQVKERTTATMILDKAVLLLDPLFKKLGIEVHRKLDFNEEMDVNVSELIQVMLNIFKNAVDALEENKIASPIIYCKVYEERNFCVFEIIDNAGGIPEHVLPKIFDKRFTTKGESHGTGIGLDMSKRIIEEHLQGTLTAHNLNDGAVFTITIPLQTL